MGGLVIGLMTGPVWCTPSPQPTVESAPGSPGGFPARTGDRRDPHPRHSRRL